MEEVQVETILYQVRAMLWANALHRTWGRHINAPGVSVEQLAPEAASLRARVEARLTMVPKQEADAIRALLPLPALRANPGTIPTLVRLVRQGMVSPAQIERFMVTSEYSGESWRQARPGRGRPPGPPRSRRPVSRVPAAVG